ncbi:hypothetical protein BKA69DRAFT_1127460 [Paraphysoderma sedebokerense]|nr:hypothetical protein BKA69DRAFT_1127460 [Paraphysoderma sedebokerense]
MTDFERSSSSTHNVLTSANESFHGAISSDLTSPAASHRPNIDSVRPSILQKPSIIDESATVPPKMPSQTGSLTRPASISSVGKVDREVMSRQQIVNQMCPLAKQTKKPCKNCIVVRNVKGGQIIFKLKCHCGREANINRARNVKSHYESDHCIKETKNLSKHNGGINSFFKRPAENPQANNLPVPPQKKRSLETKIYPCAGLNDESWPRPRKKENRTISNYVTRSPGTYHGHPPAYKVAADLFSGRTDISKLKDDEKAQLKGKLVELSKWELVKSNGAFAIYSRHCQKEVTKLYEENLITNKIVCTECWKLRTEPALLVAINADYATKETQKYINNWVVEQSL